MKNKIKLIILGIIAAMIALPLTGAEDPTEIPIVVYNPSNPQGRSQQPFSAEYDDLLNSVVLSRGSY